MPATPSPTYERLRDTIARRMRMSHAYPPLMFMELLGCRSPAPAQVVARRILGEDVTQIEVYTERVKRMVGKVLIGNGITRYDCDADVLLLSIEQVGEVACHTGARSCFYDQGSSPSAGGPGADPPPADACTELMRVIEARRDHPEPGSYTNKLLEGGDNRILKKIGEESAEFVMACKDGDPSEIAGEAADLVFHLQVALAHHGVDWRQVQAVLAARRGAPRRE